jgi:hypothetical protein
VFEVIEETGRIHRFIVNSKSSAVSYAGKDGRLLP